MEKEKDEEKVFAQMLQCENPNVIFETLKRVILNDEYLDEKQKLQKMINLIHTFKKEMTPIYFAILYSFFDSNITIM